MVKITKEAALAYHVGTRPGKIEVKPTKPYRTQTDLSLAYSPGVAYPCLEIQSDSDAAYQYTDKGNLVAVISNGTAVLGLGDIGALSGKRPALAQRGEALSEHASQLGRPLQGRQLRHIYPKKPTSNQRQWKRE